MSNKAITTAISAILALNLGSASSASTGHDVKLGTEMEKCYGVAKAHQNDCGTGLHGCGGMAQKDAMREEWVAMPKGLCDKIVGGTTKPPEKT